MTRIQELRWNRKFALWCLSGDDCKKPSRHGGLLSSTKQVERASASLGLACWLPVPALLIIRLRTGPTCFCRQARDTSFCSLSATSGMTLSKSYDFPALPFSYLEHEEAGLVYFSGSFQPYSFKTWFLTSHFVTCWLIPQPVETNPHFLQSRPSLPPLNPCTLLENVRVKAGPKVWPVQVPLGGQWEGASQLGSLANLRRGITICLLFCQGGSRITAGRSLFHHWTKLPQATGEEIKPAQFCAFLSQGSTAGHGNQSKASSLILYTMVSDLPLKTPLQGSGFLPL